MVFYAPTSVLFVMTTNHVEKLDEALLRPERIDYRLYFGKGERPPEVRTVPQIFSGSFRSRSMEIRRSFGIR
jgi:chaperone BCS1